MSEPTSALSLRELIRDVSEFIGIASYRSNGKIIVPTDAFEFEYCKRIVNEAMRKFILDSPPWGWRWMRRIASVTFDSTGGGASNIDSDAARYLLPEDFGGTVDGKITYDADTNHGTVINWVDEATIRERRAHTVISGYPNAAAVRPYQPTSSSLGSARRWELIVDPEPSANDTIKFPYTMHFNEFRAEVGTSDSGSVTTLVDSDREEPDDWFNGWIIRIIDGTGVGSYAVVTDYTGSTGTFTVADWLASDGSAGGTDPGASSVYYVEPAANLSPAGFMHDQTILAACKAVAEAKANGKLGDAWQAMYKGDALVSSMAIDRRSAPRQLGPIIQAPSAVPEREWNTITTDHDV